MGGQMKCTWYAYGNCRLVGTHKVLTIIITVILGSHLVRGSLLGDRRGILDMSYLLQCKRNETHSSILAWRIPQTEEPGGLQSTGSQRVGHNWATNIYYRGHWPRVAAKHLKYGW